jgi:hypothetical protein
MALQSDSTLALLPEDVQVLIIDMKVLLAGVISTNYYLTPIMKEKNTIRNYNELDVEQIPVGFNVRDVKMRQTKIGKYTVVYRLEC